MKANDLMIGDFVYFNCFDRSKILVRVTGFKDGIVYGDSKNGSHWCNIEKVEPITLTAKTLEEIGFVKTEENKYLRAYHLVAPTINGKISSVTQMTLYKKPIAGTNTLFECSTLPSYEGLNEIHLCNLESVHELQHALKLCGIEKEIKTLKDNEASNF